MSGVYERYSGVFPTEEEAVEAFRSYPGSNRQKRNMAAAKTMKNFYAKEKAAQEQRNKAKKNNTNAARSIATTRAYGPVHRRLTRKTRKNRR